MPSFTHSIDVPKPPAEVFPWLLDADKVPQWTSDLSTYEPEGPLANGTAIKQVISIGGSHITLNMKVDSYQPPTAAVVSFSTNGVDITNTYTVEANGDGGARVTQGLDASPSSFTARMLIPVVQGRLEKKVTDDLEKLREVLSR
jgi:carbon monoxide dehydrogenase subunit G